MRLRTGTILAAVAMTGALFIDWPRALAGFLVGWIGLNVPYATIFVPCTVLVVAALGEQVSPHLGLAHGPSWFSFAGGLVATGAAAMGFFAIVYINREET